MFCDYYDGYIGSSVNITKSQESDGVLFTSNGTAQGVYPRKQGETGNYNYPTPCCFEFDIVSFESTSDIGIQFYDGTTNITNTFNTLGITGACHVKCEYKSDKTYYSVDGVDKPPINKVCSNNARILLTNITASLKIKNVVVYPI